MTQRPQHLLTRAARTQRVYFWEEPVWDAAGGAGIWLETLQEADTLWVVRPHLSAGMDADVAQRLLLAGFMRERKIEQYVAWYYTPMALGFTDELNPVVTVYDCMDELSAFAGAPRELVQRETRLFDKADVVFTGGISLYEVKQRQHANVHAFPSSIEVNHFAQAKHGLTEPEDQAGVPGPRAGFYGVVDERFDVALLAAVAALRPQVQFVILGPVVKIDVATLPQAANIHYLGSKSYQELPAYLAGWDVALLPFALNEATRFISPTKTPEYLAAGKPVVSTPIRDVVRGYGDAGLVAIAATAEEFAAALDAALEPQTDAWHTAVEAKLATMSWDATWASMQREINGVMAAKVPAHETSAAAMHKVPALVAAMVSPVVTKLHLAPTLVDSGYMKASRRHSEHFDYVVVGAGFAGSVLAERLATELDKRVLIIDKRDHIAGNAYDFHNEDGILVHKYGPHIFHTNSEKVFEYLSEFTTWRPYEHRVLSQVDGKLLPVPINLDTINQMYGLSLDAEGMERFLAERVIAKDDIRTSEDVVLSRVGPELYEKFFRNYTRKQWGLDPSQLDAGVAGRIPVRFDRDDRYFTDLYQMMPRDGYTRMFERMLDHSNITVRTGVDYMDVARTYSSAKVIYTGPIDEYFGFRYGPLPYRSLEFKHETHNCEVYQRAPVVNYPNEQDYTRVTEFKYLTGQKHAKTSIVYEYPRSEGDPYYPIPRPENAKLYAKYLALAERAGNVHFCGRLATYRYLNMDQVVAQALTTFRRIAAPVAMPVPVGIEGARVSVSA